MSATLSGEFRIDRLEVPTFYVPKSPDNPHGFPVTCVLAESSDHFNESWITLGIVSRQSPLGQGTYCGLERTMVHEALPELILEALQRDHPHYEGADFRPGCMEAMNAGFEVAMSSAIRNWTTDDPGGSRPIRDFSRDDVAYAGNRAAAQHAELMQRWDEITAEQVRLIQEHIG